MDTRPCKGCETESAMFGDVYCTWCRGAIERPPFEPSDLDWADGEQ